PAYFTCFPCTTLFRSYDIAKALIENGYSYIQPQYKVKEDELFYNHKLGKQVYVNFKIDLVVHNNGKMIAIECDGDSFHSLPEDRSEEHTSELQSRENL